MTTNKPEVVAYVDMHRGHGRRYVSLRRGVDHYSLNDGDALIRLTDHESARAADKARIAELESALTELRDWYQDHTGLPACRANAALSHPKEDA